MTRSDLQFIVRRAVPALAFAVSLAIAGCGSETSSDNVDPALDAGSDANTEDSGTDASTVPQTLERASRELVPDQPGVDPAGLPDGETPAAGAARAYRIGERTGFEGIWAHCKSGDIRLINSVIDVCISGVASNRYEHFTGGSITDARRHDAPAEDLFDGLKSRVEFNVLFAETVEVVRDGTDGGPAVVRVVGRDTPVAHFIGLLGAGTLRPIGLEMATEYRLWPDSDAVEVLTLTTNPFDSFRAFGVGDWVAYGDELAVFRPHVGFDLGLTGPFEWSAGFHDGRAVGMVQSSPLESEILPFGDVPWLITTEGRSETEAGQSRAFFRWFVVGERDPESIRRRAAALGVIELPETEQTIVVEDSAGNGLPDRVVEVWSGDDALTAIVTDAEGRAAFLGEPGDYRVVAETIPGEPAFDETVSIDGEASVELQQAGQIRIRVDASAGDSTGTARVTLLGPGRVDGIALHGDQTWSVAPGQWQVLVRRGPEWDYATEIVDVAAGETVAVDATLTPTLDTAGWISGDFHQHMEPSIDSEVTVSDRVLDNVGHGVEFVAATDHEVVTDLNPYIVELGLESEVATFPGVEISPVYAHFGLYPMPYKPDERGRGSVPLAVIEDGEPVQRSLPEIISLARELPTAPIVQLNHARDTTGLFDRVQYDPATDPASYMARDYTLDFDVMEVINGFAEVCALYADFAGLWNAGYTPTALGNSDSHGKWGGVGQPRSWLHIDKAIADVTPDDIRAAMLEHRVTVGANAFIDFGDGRVPGDTIVSTPGADVDFHVRVQSANYASANVLITVANGNVIDRRPISSISETLDFDEIVSFNFSEDTWVGFFVWGPRPAGDVQYGDPVVAFTNPIMVDVDGDTDSDGNPFEAPGIGPIDLEQLDNNFCSF